MLNKTNFFISSLFTLLGCFTFTACQQNTASKNDQSKADSQENTAKTIAFDAKSNCNVFGDKTLYAPPLKNAEVPVSTQTTPNNMACTLSFPSGTKVQVPDAAFVDAEGNAVEGKVDVRMREFRSVAEIIASGIDMSFTDENGDQQWFQTAGMFEIQGFKEGQPVFVAKGKELTVELPSDTEGTYDFWEWKTGENNWDKIATGNTPVQAKQDMESIKTEIAQLQQATRQKPTKPASLQANQTKMSFDLDLSRFPDLAKLHNVSWVYAGSDPAQDPSNNNDLYSADWEDAAIEATSKTDVYKLTLYNAKNETLSFDVRPCLVGADLEKAKSVYAKNIELYNKNIELLRDRKRTMANQNQMMRVMRVAKFGLYNYDIQYKNPKVIRLIADFNFGEMPDEIKKNVFVYLITRKGKVVIKYPMSDWDKFSFDPNEDNKMIAVLPTEEIAVFSQADFNAKKSALRAAKDQKFIFDMKLSAGAVATLTDLENAIASL